MPQIRNNFASMRGDSSTPGTRGYLIVLIAVLLAACAPEPARPQAGASELDTARLLRHVEVLAADSMRGRRTGTEGAAMARRYIVAEMRRIGLSPVGASLEHPFSFSEQSAQRVAAVNLVGRVEGTRDREHVILVTAHYDHVGVGSPAGRDSVYNGADDNASGTAALLELADYFERNPPATTIVFAALDAEESGLRGARAFLDAQTVPAAAILLNVNMDMVSHSTAGELYVAGTHHTPRLRPLLEPVAQKAPVRLLFGHDTPVPTPADDWTTQSDHGVFHSAGIPFLYFGVEDHPDYHQPTDSFASITPAFFGDAVQTILEALKAVDASAASLERSAR